MEFRTFDDNQHYITESAKFMAHVCNEKDGVVMLALAGGKTPKPVYQLFGQGDIDSGMIHLFQVDERYTQNDHVSSNWQMIQTSLIAERDEAWRSITTFDTSLSVDEALQEYEKRLPDVPFDLIVLGVGTDGHIGSLFPHSSALSTTDLVAHTTTDVYAVRDRLTITAPVIMKAKKILILLRGEEKKTVYNELVSPTKQTDAFPAHMLQSHADVTVYYLT